MIGRIPDPLKAALGLMLAFACMIAGAARAAPTDGVYERALLLEADRRCGLFSEDTRGALQVSAAQSRSAAARAGVSRTDLEAAALRGRTRARTTACDSADLAQVVDRVRQAYSGWRDRSRMTFEAGARQWRADRVRQERPTWRLAQDGRVGASPVTVGYAAAGTEPLSFSAVVAFHGKSRPYAARVVTRDPARARSPHLPTVQASILPLPPRTARRFVWATETGRAEASLAPAGRSAEVWRFPESAAAAIAELDPRETFTVEFLFRDDSVLRVRYQAGDFAAARAFVSMGPL
ncbi:hypothetical protein [Brevundimonas lutea]|uniref:hypothetical protein n=1 Tax=Brevundimonas lutea TaxID=2293980 RepID=UPI000F02648C|nr:hypothetical protein [Brevundimonas lutea]